MTNSNPTVNATNYRNPPPMTTRDYTSQQQANNDETRADSGMLPALKGNNYRMKPTFVPMRSRFRTSAQGGVQQPESTRTQRISHSGGRSVEMNSLTDQNSFASGKISSGMSKLDINNIAPPPVQPQLSSGGAAHVPIGSYQAIPTPSEGKCPPLYSSLTQRDGLSSKYSSKPTSAGTGQSFTQPEAVIPSANSITATTNMNNNNMMIQNMTPANTVSLTMSNLTAYEEDEIKGYMPNVFYTGAECKRKIQGCRGQPSNDGYDDENGHYRVAVGDHIAYRYEILKELGRGTFGVVVKAMDHKKRQQVAVKIIKGKPSYTKQAKEEVKILELLGRDDPKDEAHIVRLLDTCSFRNHYILVFELLGMDLYTLCQLQQFKPLSMNFIYEFCCQMLVSLEYSRAHRIIHCDVKPENIVVSTSADNNAKINAANPLTLYNLKLIDFGSACLHDRRLYSYIQSRYYRAPEIVLGIPYTHAIDMWSFGCVLCELANGYPIFPASSEGELLERIIEYLGPVPAEVLAKGKRVNKFYDEASELRPNLSKKGRPRKKPFSRSLQHFLKSAEEQSDQTFFHLVSRCLEYNPSKRLTPREAMDHPWMQKMATLRSGRGK